MLTRRSDRRHVPVRLCDIPAEIRMSAAQKACRREPDPQEREAIVTAAVFPSDTVYYIAAEDEAA